MDSSLHSSLDGRRYKVRPISPIDRDHLRRGVERMSVETRYQRFLTNKETLLPEELDFLISCDGQNHIAYVCREVDADGTETDGFAVARFFRDVDDPQWGEAAIVIVDNWQNVGIGEVLLRRLAQRCLEVGVKGWRATVAGENTRAVHLFEKFGQIISRDWEERSQSLRLVLDPAQVLSSNTNGE